MKQEIMTKVE